MANTTSNNQVVYAHDDGWAVRKEGNNRATAVFETREEAMERAGELADNQDGDVYYMYTGKRHLKDRSDSEENTTENNQVVYPMIMVGQSVKKVVTVQLLFMIPATKRWNVLMNSQTIKTVMSTICTQAKKTTK